VLFAYLEVLFSKLDSPLSILFMFEFGFALPNLISANLFASFLDEWFIENTTVGMECKD